MFSEIREKLKKGLLLFSTQEAVYEYLVQVRINLQFSKIFVVFSFMDLNSFILITGPVRCVQYCVLCTVYCVLCTVYLSSWNLNSHLDP